MRKLLSFLLALVSNLSINGPQKIKFFYGVNSYTPVK